MKTAAPFAITVFFAVACGNERWSFDDVVAEAPTEPVDASNDNDATTRCAEGETLCTEGCADLRVAPRNCGVCGQTCASGLVCDLGTCHPACRAGRVDCEGSCRDLDADDRGCGGCGIQCNAPAKCRGGVCR